MKNSVIIFLCLIACEMNAQELRGAWLSRNELATRSMIAYVMDSLANNNFNVAYVNVWSRGYPLWQSDVFFKETGLSIDPNYQTRDVLKEAIIEGHRRGIEVEAWFEYGFVGGYTGYYPGNSGKGKIFDIHPDWVARKVDSTEMDNSNFYWMTQTRPEVQKFMIKLAMEVARNYDVDGIELDRIRYAGNVYGYDAFTDSVYRTQSGGNPPPKNVTDAAWMRWRADILNNFMRTAYDSIKAFNKNIKVTNAPGFYSSSSYQSYNDNLQDWWQWVRTGSVDLVQVQMYVTSNYSLSSYLSYLMKNVSPVEKIFPALAVAPAPSGVVIPISHSELTQMVNTTRSLGLKGNAWWYYGDISKYSYWPLFKSIYSTRTDVPGRAAGWRVPGIVVNENDPAVVKTDGWVEANVVGYQGKILRADSTGVKTIEYFCDVPVPAVYEVYAYIADYPLFTQRAPYDLYDSTGAVSRTFADQMNSRYRGWLKIGSVPLAKGKQKIVRLSNENIGFGKYVGADAVMLILDRRKCPDVVMGGVDSRNFSSPRPDEFRLGRNFPNPFNPQTTIEFSIPRSGQVTAAVYDLLGRMIDVLADEHFEAGSHRISWNAQNAPSGIYFYSVKTAGHSAVGKMTLVR